MNIWQKRVEEFANLVGQVLPEKWKLENKILDKTLRMRLILEEVQELQEAVTTNDFEGAVDALVDIAYVTIGTASAWGIDLEPFFAEVHEANMRKRGGPVDVGGKSLKPIGWVGPSHDTASRTHRLLYPAPKKSDDR